MLLYQFVCVVCGQDFDFLLTHREYERKKVLCPRCHSKTVEQRVTFCEAAASKTS
jgi:putative FmdB family regulatory protein